MAFFAVSLLILFASLTVPIFYYLFRHRKATKIFTDNANDFSGSIAFFHPFCNDCGGGERVLWFIISILQERFPKSNLKIYTCETTSAESIINKAAERFNITVNVNKVEFMRLSGKKWILPTTWSRFTLFGQSLGAIILALEATKMEIPNILIDTTGFVFFGAVLRLFGCESVGAYVHYPTISSDMISRVGARKTLYNNAKFISKLPFMTQIKLMYYKLFALWYKLAGKSVDFAMVNSHWTRDHISSLWGLNPDKLFVVFPPCSPHFFDHKNSPRKPLILSISQFRPEKNHKKQLKIFSLFLNMSDSSVLQKGVSLVLAGSTRSEEDTQYLDSIKQYAHKLGVGDRVTFLVNLSFPKLKALMEEALVGLHTMRDEHFGIGIVEMMASGLIVIAHASGGPESDIVVDYREKSVGFLARSVSEYVSSLIAILESEQLDEIRTKAAASVHHRFSDANFNDSVTRTVEKLILALN